MPEPNGRGVRDLVGVFVVAVFRVKGGTKYTPVELFGISELVTICNRFDHKKRMRAF